MQDYHISPVEKLKDADTIISFQQQMAQETEGHRLNEATLRPGVEAVINDPNKGVYYKCELRGEVIACLLTMNEWSDWRNGNVLWVHSVYTHKAHRSKGVFKKMYSFLKQKVSEDSSYKGLRLYVEKQNTLAQKVYEKLGMENDTYDLYQWLK